ncbi:MarR family transcriptional regulator [Nocardia sp. CA2R105]|uniref:MarR family winged helix-turn-helix transcriptional regulator n=1 Tax=Nocardia coffeae TaxID=2873381 RepID=UPI001CA64C3E|nr:MarR family transcriptional regulator [Nocardia coffeae]MBY8860769.1 MarR family transcriptional regulator [Nocardia coffeae]
MPAFLDLHSRTSKLLRALVERSVRPYGLYPGQDLVLGVLWDHDGRTPGEVAAALNVTTPTIAKMANRMTETGLLTRRGDPDDNRLVRLWLTDKGHELRDRVESSRASLENLITADLTDAERRCLLTALEKVHHSAARLLEQPHIRERRANP